MSNEVINPYQKFRDSAGLALSAGTITFYENSTTILATIYSDEALTIAQQNPYTLDGSGRITGDVKFSDVLTMKIENSDGAHIRTINDVASSGGGVKKDFPVVATALALATLKTLIGTTKTVSTDGYTTVIDGGGNTYQVVSPGTGTADGGNFINDTIDGSQFQLKATWPGGTKNSAQWGAIGGQDSTTALQAFFDDTTSSEKIILDEDYIISGLTMDNEGTLIKGLGNRVESSNQGASRFTMDNTAADAIQFNNDHCGIENMEIYGNGNNLSGLNIFRTGGGVRSGINVRDVIVKGFSATDRAGIFCSSTVLINLDHVRVENCYDALFAEQSTTLHVYGSSAFRESTRSNIRLNGMRGFQMFGGVCEGSAINGADVKNNSALCDGVALYGVWFEGNTGTAFRCGTVAGNRLDNVSLIACKFTGTNGGDVGVHIDSTTRGAEIRACTFEKFENAIGVDTALLIDAAATNVSYSSNQYVDNTNDVTDSSGDAWDLNDGSSAAGVVKLGDRMQLGTLGTDEIRLGAAGTDNPGDGNITLALKLTDSRFFVSGAADNWINRNGAGTTLVFAESGVTRQQVSVTTTGCDFTKPQGIGAFSVANLNAGTNVATANANRVAFATDAAGGGKPVYSNGTNWLTYDDVIVAT